MSIELHASRFLAAALALIAVLAAVSILLSEVQAPWSVGCAVVALAVGGLHAWQAVHAGSSMLLLRNDGSVEMDSDRVMDFHAEFHGSLTQLRWSQGGRTRRFVAWPDVLDASARRELRLWTLLHRPTGRAPAVAG